MNRRSRHSRSRSTWRPSSEAHTAALKPMVMGRACCTWVRPAITRSLWRVANWRQASSARESLARRTAWACLIWRMSPVSTMSWLVAPQCTHSPASPGQYGLEGFEQGHDGDGALVEFADGGDVYELGLGLVQDLVGRGLGNNAQFRLGLGQGRFGIEPFLHQIHVAEDVPHVLGAEQVAEDQAVDDSGIHGGSGGVKRLNFCRTRLIKRLTCRIPGVNSLFLETGDGRPGAHGVSVSDTVPGRQDRDDTRAGACGTGGPIRRPSGTSPRWWACPPQPCPWP